MLLDFLFFIFYCISMVVPVRTGGKICNLESAIQKQFSVRNPETYFCVKSDSTELSGKPSVSLLEAPFHFLLEFLSN